MKNTQKKEIKLEESFATHEKSMYWSDKNGDIKPEHISKKSQLKFWFDCDKCDHYFEKQINLITKINGWCPYCAGQKICGNNECNYCYNKSFASHPKSKYWSDKNEILPIQVFRATGKVYKFNCNKCYHEFEAPLDQITGSKNTWCPYCCIASRLLCDNNDCKSCFYKSFASCEKAKYWSDKNTVKARNILSWSKDKFLFSCDKCNHDFNISLLKVQTDYWCSFCGKKQLCEDNNCEICFDKSFASHEKAKYWSDKNELSPRQVFKSSGNNYKFNCSCGHEFETRISNISSKDGWCGYCSNPPKFLCKDNNCTTCFNKSFASHEKAKFWSNKNKLNAREVLKGCSIKFLFLCENNHEFETLPSKISCYNSWCSKCKNKTEKILFDKLVTIYPNLVTQFKVDWCKNKTFLPFDFVILEHKIIIELDGGQHFLQVSNWKAPEETQENDKYKMKCANKNNYSVIRILQEDVYGNKYNWFDELNNNIKKIINENKIQNIFICKNKEYDIYKTNY